MYYIFYIIQLLINLFIMFIKEGYVLLSYRIIIIVIIHNTYCCFCIYALYESLPFS